MTGTPSPLPVPSNAVTPPGERAPAWMWMVLITAWLGVWAWYCNHEFTYNRDSLGYLAGARGLATMGEYRFTSRDGQPGIAFYPPGQSILLAPAFLGGREFPGNVPLLNALAGLTSLPALLLLFACCCRLGGNARAALACTLLWMTASTWHQWVSKLYSDPAFLAYVLGVLLLWLRDGNRAAPARWAASGLLLGLAYLSRRSAVPIIGCMGLAALLGGGGRARWIRVGAYSVGLLPGVLLSKGLSLPTESQSYLTAWRVMLESAGWEGCVRQYSGNLWLCVWGQPLWKMVFPAVPRVVEFAESRSFALGMMASIGAAIPWLGFLRIAHRGWNSIPHLPRRMVAATAALYVLQVLLPPFPAQLTYSRYFMPLAVVGLGCFVRGLAATPRMLGWPAMSVVVAAAGVAILVNLGYSHLSVRGRIPVLGDYRAVVSWLRTNARPEQRIAAGWDLSAEHLYGPLQRPLVVDYFPVPSHPEQMVLHGAQGHRRAEYLVSETGATGLLQALPKGLLKPVFHAPEGTLQVFAVDPAMEPAFHRTNCFDRHYGRPVTDPAP